MAKPKTKPQGAFSWDTVQAEKDYISDNTLSYADIAKKYGVSKSAVQRLATDRDWPRRRQEATEKGLEQFAGEQAKKIAEAETRHLAYYKNMQSLGNNALVRLSKEAGENKVPDVKSALAAGNLLKMGIDGERVIMGLPTSVAAHTGKDGENIWTGFAEMVKAADEVLDGND